jgi:hypothetical protein
VRLCSPLLLTRLLRLPLLLLLLSLSFTFLCPDILVQSLCLLSHHHFFLRHHHHLTSLSSPVSLSLSHSLARTTSVRNIEICIHLFTCSTLHLSLRLVSVTLVRRRLVRALPDHNQLVQTCSLEPLSQFVTGSCSRPIPITTSLCLCDFESIGFDFDSSGPTLSPPPSSPSSSCLSSVHCLFHCLNPFPVFSLPSSDSFDTKASIRSCF